MARVIGPLEGFPPTRWTRDENRKPALRVDIHEPTALRAKIADGLAVASGVAWVASGLVGAAQANAEAIAYLLAVVFPVACFVPMRWFWRSALKKHTRLVVKLKTVEVRTAWRTRIYDRLGPHTFEFSEHRRAQEEREQHELEMRRDPVRRTRYYSSTYRLIYSDRNQRREIASVWVHPDRAQEYIDKFQLCDEEMDKLLHGEDNGWRNETGEVDAA